MEASATRRDFLYIATGAVAAVGACATLVPMISQLSPDAATLAAGGPVDFDASKLQQGQQAVVRSRSRPVVIVSRPANALKVLQDAKLLSRRSDAHSDEPQQPPYARNWHRSIKPDYGVLIGICTHLGCIPLFYPTGSPVNSKSWPDRSISWGMTGAAPGLALIATEDHYCGGETLARRSAERAGAKVAVLKGAGHWWMCQQPKQGAQAINAFLAKLN